MFTGPEEVGVTTGLSLGILWGYFAIVNPSNLFVIKGSPGPWARGGGHVIMSLNSKIALT